MTLLVEISGQTDVDVSTSVQDEISVHRLTVVIPTLNEADNIVWVLDRLPAYVDEVVIVDGRSTDGTVEVAQRRRADVKIVEEVIPGKGAALRAGFAAATGDFVVMLDADGSMDPGEIDAFVHALGRGYDLVKGSRFLPEGGSEDLTFVRRWGNVVLRGIANLLFRAEFSDLCYGYMALRRDAIPAMRLRADGFEIETEIVTGALRAGLNVTEVASFERNRRNGVSHLVAFRDGPRVLRKLLSNRLRRFRDGSDIQPMPLLGSSEAAQA